MNKLILYLSLVVAFGIYLSGCSESVPNNVAIESERPVNYIVRDGVNNRVSGTNTPLFGHEGLKPSHVRGGRIYDDFMIELGVISPGNNPLAALAAGGVIAADEWQCSGCHGFDYEGVATFNEADINLQDLIPVRARDEAFVMNMLNDGFMLADGSIAHSYANILTPQAMVDVADFVVNELYDVHEYLSAARGVALSDMRVGMNIFNNDLLPLPSGVAAYIRSDGTAFSCVMCHDGVITTDIVTLKEIAKTDPFKFLHRINFGSPRDVMTKGFGYGDNSVMPGLYEVILTDGLHFGGPEQASSAMFHIQMQP